MLLSHYLGTGWWDRIACLHFPLGELPTDPFHFSIYHTLCPLFFFNISNTTCADHITLAVKSSTVLCLTWVTPLKDWLSLAPQPSIAHSYWASGGTWCQHSFPSKDCCLAQEWVGLCMLLQLFWLNICNDPAVSEIAFSLQLPTLLTLKIFLYSFHSDPWSLGRDRRI